MDGNVSVLGTVDVVGGADVEGYLAVKPINGMNTFYVDGATGNTSTSGDLDVDGFSQLDGVNTDGDLSVNTNMFTVAAATGNTAIAGTTTSEGDLTVNANSDLNGNLDVEGETALNTANNAGTVLTINDAAGMPALTVATTIVDVQTNTASTTLTVPSLTV